jgi:hypothetical protein
MARYGAGREALWLCRGAGAQWRLLPPRSTERASADSAPYPDDGFFFDNEI